MGRGLQGSGAAGYLSNGWGKGLRRGPVMPNVLLWQAVMTGGPGLEDFLLADVPYFQI